MHNKEIPEHLWPYARGERVMVRHFRGRWETATVWKCTKPYQGFSVDIADAVLVTVRHSPCGGLVGYWAHQRTVRKMTPLEQLADDPPVDVLRNLP